MKNNIETEYKLIGWKQNGQPIETPDGIHAEDYFRDGRYIGPDQDGVEPILQIRYEDGIHMTQYFTNERPEGWLLCGYDGVLRYIEDEGEIADAFAARITAQNRRRNPSGSEHERPRKRQRAKPLVIKEIGSHVYNSQMKCDLCGATCADTSKEQKRFLRRHSTGKCTERKEFSKQLAAGVRSVEPINWVQIAREAIDRQKRWDAIERALGGEPR